MTALVHFSGGVASWFWPVYFLVTIEAAVLFEEPRDVWWHGALGGLLYGALLGAENLHLISFVEMPFVNPWVHNDVFNIVLLWLWVSILNGTVAVIAAFLMGVIRRENVALRESETKLIGFLNSANDLIFSFTPEGKFLYVNRSWKQILGYDLDALADMTMLDIVQEEQKVKCLAGFRRSMAGAKVTPIEGYFLSRDGHPVAVEGNITCNFRDGAPESIWGICRDITQRKEAQEQLLHMAHHDTLTGLPNRRCFLDRLKQALALARRLEHRVAILFLDLDRFKIINDTLGHGVGDKLLKEVATRLSACVREVDTVARIGGDEFILTLVNLNQIADAELVSRKILKSLAAPVQIDGNELFITTSIGISVYPGDADDPSALVKKADVAMYHAKAMGKNNSQFYTPALDRDALRKLGLENSMRKALERGEFRVYFQPKVDTGSGKMSSLEALLRWQHPELGFLLPAEFLNIAEETGMIVPIGEWVLSEVCRQSRLWQDAGLPLTPISVNLSGVQLQQKNLAETISGILATTGLDGRSLELEITETVIMQNPDFTIGILNELKAIGVSLSIDDFGTGYSSLAHLKRFAVNTLKIDKSFVRDVDSNPADAAIATAIIAMANSLNLKVVAEGVETLGQLSFLQGCSCDEVQGFYFSRALPASEIEAFLGKIFRQSEAS
ncbi:diguanylate cyclase/phosphodiesterase with PAS/PAC sensor(s) [Desulfuromonas soudanensis]|uniref:Diguanylate cyclase/phosphodiesterase with PAS/PAC sensor(S) n=1 Tax=Desulfuromonas soudanensis TaxID=1603606 RepID=A0A0M4DFS6_9BACT|nr:EAL domain-containing protein [Desulfuromonas soudanensis]ALC15395.1 diguanylate cyclase/phosphodiesterase with PAS/PAC sensor(s) [Desulfuromonas soudanensis]